MEGIKEKVEYLNSIGLEIEEIYDEDNIIVFETEGNYYEISSDSFDHGDSLNSILGSSEIYSGCCGEKMDSDFMICPSCKEHC